MIKETFLSLSEASQDALCATHPEIRILWAQNPKAARMKMAEVLSKRADLQTTSRATSDDIAAVRRQMLEHNATPLKATQTPAIDVQPMVTADVGAVAKQMSIPVEAAAQRALRGDGPFRRIVRGDPQPLLQDEEGGEP